MLERTGDYDRGDYDALERAIWIARREQRLDFDARLLEQDWTEVAEFASTVCQRAALHLKPWQSPPCDCDENDPAERDKNGQALLRRMLAAGISRYEPNPLEALKAAKKPKRKVKRKK
jgi:hypothetical protein